MHAGPSSKNVNITNRVVCQTLSRVFLRVLCWTVRSLRTPNLCSVECEGTDSKVTRQTTFIPPVQKRDRRCSSQPLCAHCPRRGAVAEIGQWSRGLIM